MIQVLCRRRKNNPLLVGEPGVGKTALAEGLALRIHQGDVPEVLKAREGLRARPRRAGRRHALSRRLRGARQAGARSRSRRSTNAILFIDEIHSLVGAGVGVGRRDGRRQPAEAGAGVGHAALHRLDDVHRREAVVRRDRALSRRFQKIDVLEPSEAETLEILKGLRPHYEAHHGVQLHRRGARGGGDAVGASI